MAFSEPCVLIATARAASGFTPGLPSFRPGISRNCRRTSSIISPAAVPTACIVNPENRKGSSPPITVPMRALGSNRSSSVTPVTSE